MTPPETTPPEMTPLGIGPAQDEPLLRVRGLGKAYRGRAVLRALSLDVQSGEAVAVVGPNGAGKSTLLGCITGDRTPDTGEVLVCGDDAFRDLAAAARCIGYVPERPYLYDELTVAELLRFVAEARGLPAGAADAETHRLLGLLSMRGAESVLCRELSQGMGRKTAIAAALLHRPPLIVLDEAFNGLDLTSVQRLRGELDARRDAGDAVLISSHDLGFLAEWCDRGLFLAPDAASVMLDGERWAAWKAEPSVQP